MNKKVPEITESVETLKALLRKAIKKHEIQRLNTLYLLKSGVAKNRLQVADLLGVHRLSVGDWLSAYETGGLEKLLHAATLRDAHRFSLKNSKPSYVKNFRNLKVFRVMFRSKSISLTLLVSR